jgi:DNA-binding ferritin-like protein
MYNTIKDIPNRLLFGDFVQMISDNNVEFEIVSKSDDKTTVKFIARNKETHEKFNEFLQSK